MYFVMVVGLMVVLPALSIAVEVSTLGATFGVALIAKWFVFWGVGWRLLAAGVKQVLQPGYTANLLGLKTEESLILVRELGFSNVAIGAAGVASMWIPTWTMAIALVGGLYYLFAGVNHVLRPRATARESMAMISDLLMAALLLAVCTASAFMH